MKIINCEQGTEEWLKHRLGIATASEFSKVITSTGKDSESIRDYALQLASELLTTEQDPIYTNDSMIRGTELEGDAREAYEEHFFCVVDTVGFMKCDDYGYSPDGLIGDDGLIEIKCPSQKVHTKYLFNNKLPTEYKTQVQGGLLVSGRKWCDFISYHPGFIKPHNLFVKRIFRDEDYISALKAGLDKLTKLKLEFLAEIKNRKK